MTLSVLFPLLLVSASPQPYAEASPGDPRVQVWLSSDAEYRLGDHARVYVRTADDGYLVVLHADPEGRVRVLFPLDPGIDDDFVRGGQSLEIRGRSDRDAFLVEERSGSGVVLAAWSEDPFRFDGLVRGDHWDYRNMAPGGLGNDLEAGLLDIVHIMAPTRRFSYDAIPYVVGRPASYDRGSVNVGVGYGNAGWRSGWNSGFHVSLSFGNAFYYDPWYYDSWYAYGRPYWHRPVWHRPIWHRPVWYYDPFYYPWGYAYPYRPRIRYVGVWDHYRPSRPGLARGYGWSDDDGWGRGKAKQRSGSSVFPRDLILTETLRGGTPRGSLGQRLVSGGDPAPGGPPRSAQPSSLTERIRTEPPPNEPSRARVIPGGVVERRAIDSEASREPPRTSEPSRSRAIPRGIEPERRGVRTIQSEPPASEPSRSRAIPRGVEPERRGVRTIQSEPPASEPSRSRAIPRGVEPERRGVRTIQSEPPASEPSRSRAIPRGVVPSRAQPEERRGSERSIRNQVTVERGAARQVPRENVSRTSRPSESVRSSPQPRSGQSRPAPSVKSSGGSTRSAPARASRGVARGRRN